MKPLAMIVALLLMAVPAQAQDVKWSGPYAGVLAGYGWMDGDQRQTNGGMVAGPFDVEGEGALAGVVIGYNRQFGQLVIGAELEGGWMDIEGKGRIPSSSPAHHQKIDAQSGFYGLAAARLGFAWDRSLFYGKGGYAFLEGDSGQQTTKPGFETHRSGNFQGFVYGAGVEHMLNEKISIKFEWLRFDLDQTTGFQRSLTDVPIGFEYTNSTDAKIDTLRLGVNVRF
jgi:outer membrane immunogenic protein